MMMGLKKNHHQQDRNKSQQRMKKKPRRVSNLGLLANTRTRSKNDGFDDPQPNEAAERRRRNRVSRFGWWCERNREREGEKRGAAASVRVQREDLVAMVVLGAEKRQWFLVISNL